MKKQLWGYLRPLLLGAITATVLLWSVTVAVPAAATSLYQPEEPLSLSSSDLPARAGIRGSRPGFRLGGRNDEVKELRLSLPFAVESQWESVSNDTPGIIWRTTAPTFTSQTISTQPPLSRGGGVGIVPLLPEEGLGEVEEIKFGIKNGQFIANATDTWFVYGWFGALSAIKQPYNIKYPEWGDRHNGIDFVGREGLDIVSASTGKVIFAGRKIGNTVIVNAGNNYQITYGHLQDISVKKGQILRTGNLIGHLGKTGTVNPHLHFQVDLIKKDSRTAINPAPLMDAEWGSIVIPVALANQFYTDNQDPLSQPDFLW